MPEGRTSSTCSMLPMPTWGDITAAHGASAVGVGGFGRLHIDCGRRGGGRGGAALAPAAAGAGTVARYFRGYPRCTLLPALLVSAPVAAGFFLTRFQIRHSPRESRSVRMLLLHTDRAVPVARRICALLCCCRPQPDVSTAARTSPSTASNGRMGRQPAVGRRQKRHWRFRGRGIVTHPSVSLFHLCTAPPRHTFLLR